MFLLLRCGMFLLVVMLFRSTLQRQLYFRASLYSVYVEDWLKVFPRDQIMVIKGEDYYDDRRNVLERVFKFLVLGEC